MVKSNLGNVYKSKTWARRFARGRPVRKVAGGWTIGRGQKKGKTMAKRRKSSRKTFKKKTTARKAARGKGVYKVKGGYRISRGKKRRRRKKAKRRRRKPGHSGARDGGYYDKAGRFVVVL